MRPVRPLAVVGLTLVLSLALCGPADAAQQTESGGSGPRVWLRLAADSAVVGHYRFTVRETRRIVFDIAPDDPRAELLRSATTPKQTVTDIAATVVSTPVPPDEGRRYVAYWLGFKFGGDDVRGLSALQWDSIFQKVGRRAVLRFSPRGRPQGVEVGSDAVRPVGRAMARTLAGLALTLPADSVAPGARWEGRVAITLQAPDGSELVTPIQVTYRIRSIEREADGLYARIEFDGEPVAGASGPRVKGNYFGESVFAVNSGRYERLMALANLEIPWEDSTGLPPSRILIEWRGEFTRY
jgi:hypothetical protein